MQTLVTPPPGPPHAAVSATVPTDVRSLDARRIERALRQRTRYRYVQPRIEASEGGWCITCPCCSRNIDPDGGVIDIAWLRPTQGMWELFRKDHATNRWVAHRSARSLPALMDEVCADPLRIFWP